MQLPRYAGRHLKSDLENADRQLAAATGKPQFQSSANDISIADGSKSAEVTSPHNQSSHQPERHLSTAKEQLTAGSLFRYLAYAEQRYRNEFAPLKDGGGSGAKNNGSNSTGSENTIHDLKFVCDNFGEVAGPQLARLVRSLVQEMAAVLECDAAVAAATAEVDDETSGGDGKKLISTGPTNADAFVEVLEAALSRAKRRSGRMPTQALFPAREIASYLESARSFQTKQQHPTFGELKEHSRPSRKAHFNEMYESAQQAKARLTELREATMAAESVCVLACFLFVNSFCTACFLSPTCLCVL